MVRISHRILFFSFLNLLVLLFTVPVIHAQGAGGGGSGGGFSGGGFYISDGGSSGKPKGGNKIDGFSFLLVSPVD
jgi:hypothetical protein